MKRLPLLLCTATVAALSTSAALADCREELAAFTDIQTSADAQMTGAVSTDAEAGTASDATPALGTDGISKDGSLAPLEQTEAGANTGTTTFGTEGSAEIDVSGQTATGGMAAETTADAAGAIKKDGSTMPLASSDGGGDPTLATSPQDVEAQQEGMETAAAASDAYESDPDVAGVSTTVEEAVAKARLFLAQGNEEACMEAIEDAKRLRGE